MTSKSLPGEEPTDDLPTDDLPTDDLPTDDLPTDDLPPEDGTVADATVTDGFAANATVEDRFVADATVADGFVADGTLPDDRDPPDDLEPSPFAGLPDDRDPQPFSGLPAPQWLSEGAQPVAPPPPPGWAQAPRQESSLPPPPFEPSPAPQAQAPAPAPAFGMPPPGPPPVTEPDPGGGPRPPGLEPFEPWRLEKPVRRGPLVQPRAVLKVLAGVAALGLAAAAVAIVVMDSGAPPELKSGARLAGGLFKGAPSATSDGRTQELTSVAASGNTVVAVGGEFGPNADRGQFLHSADAGRTFSLVPVKAGDGQEQFGEAIPEVVAASSTGWAAIGRRPGGLATWTSKDGQSWIRQPDAGSDVFDDDDRVGALIPTGKGFLAVGSWARKDDLSDAVPVLWQSSDGRRWDRRDRGRLDLGGVKEGSLQLVNAAFDGNTILLQGLFTKNPGKPDPGINRPSWFSDDGGRSWTPAKVPVLPGTSGLVVGGGPKGLVAVREVRKGSEAYGQVFTRGGGKWVKAGQIKAAGLRRLVRVTATDQGYAAVFVVPGGVALQRSADAVTWQDAGTVPFSGRSQILGAAATPELTVIVGRNTVDDDTDAALAIRDAGGTEIPVNLTKVAGAQRPEQVVSTVASSDGLLVAVGGAYGDASIWTSRDGKGWVAGQASGATFTGLGSQRLLDVVKGGAGWLAVGFDRAGSRRPLVATSPDARTWQATDGAGAFKAKSDSLATIGLAAGPAGYVIVGEDGPSAAAWFSADLKSWERGKEGRRGDLTASAADNQWMRAVTGGSFGYVAVGGRHDPDVREGPPGRPVFWTSADGRTWKRQQLPLARQVYEGVLTHVSARGTTLVAVGTAVTKDGPRPLSYLSVDGGANWQETALPVPAGTGESRVTAATVTGTGFAVTGALGRPGTADAVLWTSADGRTWKAEPLRGPELAGPGDQRITGLASFQNRLLGVGTTTDRRGDQPTLWVGP